MLCGIETFEVLNAVFMMMQFICLDMKHFLRLFDNLNKKILIYCSGKIENIIVKFMVLKVSFELRFVLIDDLVEFVDFDRFEVVINKVNINNFMRIRLLLVQKIIIVI